METRQVPGPVLNITNNSKGRLDITTHWVIKGVTTDKIRHSYGYGTIDQSRRAYSKPTDSNTVVLGIAKTVMSNGLELFNHVCNVWD